MVKGRSKSPAMFERVLRRRVHETFGNSAPSFDELIDGLRAHYPEYNRHKVQVFTRMVRQTLDSSTNQKSKRNDDGSSYSDDSSPASKKAKKIDSREQMLESKRKRIDRLKSSSTDGEEDRSAVEDEDEDDEVYSLQFDLTKSMLRNTYNNRSKNVELEVVTNNKENTKVDLMKENTKVDLLKENIVDKSSSDDGDVKVMFKDLGGMEGVLDDLKMNVMVPLYHPKVPQILRVSPITGILLHGPPGCGKTKLAHAIANETGVPFYKISATELVSGISGASEENIRELFSKAYRTAPSIVFIDEIDAIASKRENLQREMERRIVTQLMTCMDESHKPDGERGYVLVIGATNRPDAVDPALRRPGRFDREISLGVPDEKARLKILTVLARSPKLEGAVDLVKISRATLGFVGADLVELVKQAGCLAWKRIIDGREKTDDEESWKKEWTSEELERLSITMSDFEVAMKLVQPSSTREGFSSIPDETWEDVGGYDILRKEFDRYIVRRIKYPDVYEKYGVDLETGFLLYGPPGCGKTLIAKAVANEARATFIHIQGPELLNKYVGESEAAVRNIFKNARKCSPCIIFFDEVDALTTKRGKEGGWVVERLLNQLLIELDGADQRKGVYVIGATNRPGVMDPALLRPGRFGKLLYVPLPNEDERGLILKALAKKMPLDADVDLISIGRSEACANLSGADLKALINEAAMRAADETFSKIEAEMCLSHTIKARHFELELTKRKPSVSDEQREFYFRMSQSFSAS